MKYSIPSSLRASRGSSLIAVLIYMSVLLILVGSLLKWTIGERRLNLRTAALLESRNAAEALAEYGFSQIKQKFETRSTFSLDPTGSDALAMPPTSFWSGSNVNLTTIELVGGTRQSIPASGLYYVDPADPNNEFDPLRGKWIVRTDIAVIAKATVTPRDNGAPITSYVMERISMRGAPLFAHAIFYNMDMEIFPGPVMNIYGPVHVNGNIFCSSQGNSLNFYGPVTTSAGIYHAWKNTIASTHGTGSETLGTTPVQFLNRQGALTSMLSGTIWKDSTMGIKTYTPPTPDPSFRTYASQTWNGNLQTAAHGIQVYKPVAVGEYKEQATTSSDNNNAGRALIEGANWPATSDANYTAKLEVEKQKYSNNAGIYIKVDPSTNQIISITSRKKGSIGDATAIKTLTSTATNNYKDIVVYRPFTMETPPAASVPTAPTASGSGTTKTTTASLTSTNSIKVLSGMYDKRRGKGVDLVDIDIGKLKDAVTEMQKAAGSRDTTKAIDNLDTTDWTGIVYVDVVGTPTTRVVETSSGAGDQGYTDYSGVASALTTAVRIVNGAMVVPTYSAAAGAEEGLTIATNAPVYIKGSFNADGLNLTTGGSDPTQSTSRKPDTGEVPAAVVADAITILSPGFNEANSLSQSVAVTTTISQNWVKSGSTWVVSGAPTITQTAPTTTTTVPSTPTAAAGSTTTAQVEIAAALLMGVTPTNKDGNLASSGGVHNFPRFLESWSGIPVWIRGSLVGLFESRVATEKWTTNFYGPPNRNWGFNDLFAAGRYPPGTPKVLSYRRVDYTDLSAARYAAVKASFNWPSP